MAQLIRRHSMEHLDLYDLDEMKLNSTTNSKLSSQTASPFKHCHRHSLINPPLERYQFLCNVERSKVDPIYAATPMFTTIPQSSYKENEQQFYVDSFNCVENNQHKSCLPSKSDDAKPMELIEDEKEDNDIELSTIHAEQSEFNNILSNRNCKELIGKIFNRN